MKDMAQLQRENEQLRYAVGTLRALLEDEIEEQGIEGHGPACGPGCGPPKLVAIPGPDGEPINIDDLLGIADEQPTSTTFHVAHDTVVN